MMKSRIAFFLILAPLFSIESLAQKKNSPSVKSKSAPTKPTNSDSTRTLSGVMWENRITVKQSDWINEGKELFEYRLASARIADGRLEFTGSYRETGKEKAEVVTAILSATTARSANPWPGAGSPTARERRPSSQQRERAAGEVNEQTQSLYSAAEPGTGCELIYLKMQPPNRQTLLQVGVVLAHRDNAWGHQINQALCRLVRAMSAKENTDEALSKLNRMISRE